MLHAEVSEQVIGFERRDVADPEIEDQLVLALLDLRHRNGFDRSFVDVIAVDVHGNGLAVERDFRIFRRFERKMRAFIFDVGIEGIAKPYLILRIFVERLDPRLRHLTVADMEPELAADDFIGLQDVQCRSHFAAVYAVFRSVEQQHVRLGELEFRAVSGIFGFAVIFVGVNESICGFVFSG